MDSAMAGGSSSRRTKAHHGHMIVKCPRCDSANTKFCYYNNYNMSQPRHFCKSCRRYWTNGGALRNVPVGGGCRKSNKRSANQFRKPRSGGAASSSANFIGASAPADAGGPLEFLQLTQDRILPGHIPVNELDPSEMQWGVQGSIPGDDDAPLKNMMEQEAVAKALWDLEAGNGIFPFNFDCGGDALLEVQIGDLGFFGGGGW